VTFDHRQTRTRQNRRRWSFEYAIDLGRLGEEIAREKSGRIVAKSVGRLADALDADDHIQGRREINHAAPIMVAMAILAGWELGALSPF